MKKKINEILLCMAEQGYEDDVVDFMNGDADINIYDWEVVEVLR